MLINNQISVGDVRVIGNDGEQLGIMNITQAQKLADEDEFDVVLIAPTAKPPVVKICDYAKYRFEAIKKEKEQRKAQKVVKLKEVQLSLAIQENEIAFKLKNARRFIEDGDKVKVCINRIRGRQTMFADKGVTILNNFYERCKDIADIDSPVAKTGVAGRNMNVIMVLAPKKLK